MSNRTVIRTVITPRAITRRVGPAGAGGGATTFAALTDKATADLPAINTPLASALSGKQPLDADLTSWAGVTRAAGFDPFTATPSSANLRSLVTDETGSGALVFGTSPTLAGFSATGAVTFSTGTTFTYGAGIAAAHRTALGLGSLATQSGDFSGTHSGDSSGTNTGDQDLSNFLSRRTILEVNGTDAPISQSLVEQGYLSNGRRVWANGDGGTLLYDGASWFLTQLDPDSLVVYDAFKTSGSYEPWLLTGWTVTNGSGEPTFVLDPAEPLGNGVIIALDLPADTNGGFLTAGTGGTLPIARGGTGATTAGLARTNLGSGATGDALFTAATPSAARTTLGVRTFTKSANQSKFNDTTYADDSELKDIPLEIGKSYKIEFYIAAYLPLTEGGKARLLVPYGNVSAIQAGFVTTAQWGNSSTGPINITNAATRIFSLADNAGYNQTRALSGVAYTGTLTQSGVLSLQWAQRTSGANAMIMQAGSLITVTEL